jgi:ABC-2 type transport system permease protein
MPGAFASEWIKLRRRAVLLWGLGAGLLFTVLITIFQIERATRTLMPSGHGARLTIAQLSQADGLAHGLVDAGGLVGIIALCLFAGSTASEYSQRTLSNLLIREPRRWALLAGKFLALVVFIALTVWLAFLLSAVFAFLLAPGKGISTSAWTSQPGLNDLGQSYIHVVLACAGYGIFGTMVAIIVRSPGAAIGIAVAWILPAEAIITAIWSSGDRYLPGQLLSTLVSGGSSDSSYGRTLAILVIYAVLASAGTIVLFSRRDA